MTAELPAAKYLLAGVGRCVCAFPLAHVIETMRPLPIQPLPGAPAFVRGVAVVRGAPTPVVSLSEFLGSADPAAFGRFVTVRAAPHSVALAVDAVLGIREISGALLEDLPPLLRESSADLIDSIGSLDSKLLVVLRSGRLVPDSVWRALAEREGQTCP